MSRFIYLIIGIVSFSLVSISSVSAQTVLLYDDFNTLDPAVWSNGGCCGGGVSINNGVVLIDGGTTNGAGYTIDTISSFPMDSSTILTLELRAFNTGPNGGLFMFWKRPDNQRKAVGFRTISPGILNASAWTPTNTSVLEKTEEVVNKDITQWHIYRVEYRFDVVRYYVDDELVATITTTIPEVNDIPVRFSGENRNSTQSTLNVDWVKVTSTPIITNNPPDCSGATPSQDSLWPPNHNLEIINVLGINDPDGDTVAITIDSIFQDEPTNDTGDGSTSPDGFGINTDTAEVRAERSGNGNGRIYHISYSANDGAGGSCSGIVMVSVNKSQGKKGKAVDDGAIYDSTQP